MNYFKNHIMHMALLAFFFVFSAYASEPKADATATSIFKHYPFSIRLYEPTLIGTRTLKGQPTEITSAPLEKNESQTTENTTPKTTNTEPELISNKLKGKLLSALSRSAWIDHGDQIIGFVTRCWPFLARFF